MKAVCFQIQTVANNGLLDDEVVFKDILESTARNFHRKGKNGKGCKASVKDFYETIMYLGGPRLAYFVTIILRGREIYTIYQWMN